MKIIWKFNWLHYHIYNILLRYYLKPDLILETNILGIEECAEKIFSKIKSQFQIN